jgi:hypothetical protein
MHTTRCGIHQKTRAPDLMIEKSKNPIRQKLSLFILLSFFTLFSFQGPPPTHSACAPGAGPIPGARACV